MKTRINFKTIMFPLTVFILISSFSVAFGIGIKIKVNENIVTEKWGSEKTHVKVPGGIVFLDDFIYATDKEEGTIVVLDREGNFQNQSSADDLFLIEPTIIKTDGKLLYVIDSGINQLKIVTKNFELLKSINLPVLFPGFNYWDLEIIDKKIYLSSNLLLEEYAAIYELDENGTVHKISKGFIGYLSNFSGELMAANSLEYFKGENENGLEEEGGKSGKNSLFKVTDYELKLEFEYLSKYMPLDFLLVNDFIYVFSGAYKNLDKYTTDGQYVETLLQLVYTDIFIQLALCDNSILVAVPFKKAIYKVNIN